MIEMIQDLKQGMTKLEAENTQLLKRISALEDVTCVSWLTRRLTGHGGLIGHLHQYGQYFLKS